MKKRATEFRFTVLVLSAWLATASARETPDTARDKILYGLALWEERICAKLDQIPLGPLLLEALRTSENQIRSGEIAVQIDPSPGIQNLLRFPGHPEPTGKTLSVLVGEKFFSEGTYTEEKILRTTLAMQIEYPWPLAHAYVLSHYLARKFGLPTPSPGLQTEVDPADSLRWSFEGEGDADGLVQHLREFETSRKREAWEDGLSDRPFVENDRAAWGNIRSLETYFRLKNFFPEEHSDLVLAKATAALNHYSAALARLPTGPSAPIFAESHRDQFRDWLGRDRPAFSGCLARYSDLPPEEGRWASERRREAAGRLDAVTPWLRHVQRQIEPRDPVYGAALLRHELARVGLSEPRGQSRYLRWLAHEPTGRKAGEILKHAIFNKFVGNEPLFFTLAMLRLYPERHPFHPFAMQVRHGFLEYCEEGEPELLRTMEREVPLESLLNTRRAKTHSRTPGEYFSPAELAAYERVISDPALRAALLYAGVAAYNLNLSVILKPALEERGIRDPALIQKVLRFHYLARAESFRGEKAIRLRQRIRRSLGLVPEAAGVPTFLIHLARGFNLKPVFSYFWTQTYPEADPIAYSWSTPSRYWMPISELRRVLDAPFPGGGTVLESLEERVLADLADRLPWSWTDYQTQIPGAEKIASAEAGRKIEAAINHLRANSVGLMRDMSGNSPRVNPAWSKEVTEVSRGLPGGISSLRGNVPGFRDDVNDWKSQSFRDFLFSTDFAHGVLSAPEGFVGQVSRRNLVSPAAIPWLFRALTYSPRNNPRAWGEAFDRTLQSLLSESGLTVLTDRSLQRDARSAAGMARAADPERDLWLELIAERMAPSPARPLLPASAELIKLLSYSSEVRRARLRQEKLPAHDLIARLLRLTHAASRDFLNEAILPADEKRRGWHFDEAKAGSFLARLGPRALQRASVNIARRLAAETDAPVPLRPVEIDTLRLVEEGLKILTGECAQSDRCDVVILKDAYARERKARELRPIARAEDLGHALEEDEEESERAARAARKFAFTLQGKRYLPLRSESRLRDGETWLQPSVLLDLGPDLVATETALRLFDDGPANRAVGSPGLQRFELAPLATLNQDSAVSWVRVEDPQGQGRPVLKVFRQTPSGYPLGFAPE